MLTVTGDIVNNGTLRIAGSTAFSATGTLTNNGILDLLTSPSSMPANLVNHGIIIENTQRTITSAAKSGNDFICTCTGYSGHSYQLQSSLTLNDGWTNVGTPVAGTGLAIEWTVTNGGTGEKGFYRVLVTP